MSPYFKTFDGTPVYPLGMGTTGTGTAVNTTPSRNQQSIDLFKRAIDLGVNCFDTAEIYGGGHAESLLGSIVRPMRESLFIVTKFNPDNSEPKRLRKALENSLYRLRCDYVDHYQLHWPNPFVPFEKTWQELNGFLEDGKIRSIGVGNCSMEELKEYWRISDGGISAIEICFNASVPGSEETLISWCQEKGIIVFAYSPLGQGKLIVSPESNIDCTAVGNLCAYHNCTIQSLLLAWVSSMHGVIPVVRTTSPKHIKENCSAILLKLTPEERMVLAAEFRSEPNMVRLDSVKLFPIDSREIYMTETEALENRLDWIPSPNLLAERIRLGSKQPPLQLQRNKDGSLSVDPYDFQGEMKKYWALRLLYSDTAEVAAYVHDRSL